MTILNYCYKHCRTAILISITGWLFGCDKKPVESLSPAMIVGSYAGQYENGLVESFTIKSDGTFSQSLSKGSIIVYSSEGRWQVDQSDVIFHNIFLAVDVWKLNGGKPVKTDSFRAHWNPHGPAIVFSEDEHYWVEKQSSQHP